MRRMIFALALFLTLASVAFALAQNETAPPLQITVDNQTCHFVIAESVEATAVAEPTTTATSTLNTLNLATNTPRAAATAATVAPTVASAPEVTSTPVVALAGVPVLTLGDDCAGVTSLLHVPSNGTLWVELATSANEFPWQRFEIIPNDPNPPKLDKRGRFVGCENPALGAYTCHVLWSYLNATYQIDIPVVVRSAYVVPPAAATAAQAAAQATAVPISTPVPDVNRNIYGWGDCGSCTTCGGPVDHCVLSPDNQCLWDAARCERKSS